MATYGPVQLPSFFADDATFRQWAQGIHDALVALGLVQTADTGQINLATVARPAGASTVAGYEIWRFNDALQAATPVFIKVEYATSGAVDRPSLWFTVGRASNGAGTLTGVTGTRLECKPNTSATTGVTKPLYASGGPNRMTLFLNLDEANTNFALGFHVERVKNDAGVEQADMGVFYAQLSSVQVNASGILPQTAVLQTHASWPMLNLGAMKAAHGADVALGQVQFAYGKWYSMLLHHGVSIPMLTPFQMDVLGQTRTFLPIPGLVNMPGGAPYQTPVIPWE